MNEEILKVYPLPKFFECITARCTKTLYYTHESKENYSFCIHKFPCLPLACWKICFSIPSLIVIRYTSSSVLAMTEVVFDGEILGDNVYHVDVECDLSIGDLLTRFYAVVNKLRRSIDYYHRNNVG